MALRYYEGMFLFDSTEASKDWPAMVAHVEAILAAAPGPIRWHYRQKINAMVYQAIIE